MATNYIVDQYLQAMKGKEIRVFMVNGFRLIGILEAYDNVAFRIRDTNSQKEKLIFFSGITTIEPL